PVFLCCDGCRKSALANPKKTLAKVAEFSKTQPKASPAVASSGEPADVAEAEIQSALAKLSSADREVAIAQRFCVGLGDSRRGSMGMPEKLVIDGKTVFVCCEGCNEEALADPQKTLNKLASLRASTAASTSAGSATESNESEEAEIIAALAKLS